MSLAALKVAFAFAPAPPAGTAPNPTAQLLQMMGMIGFMLLMLYFVVILPQKKKSKEHALLMSNIKPGDKILTASGIIGTVVAIKDKTLSIRSADTKLEIVKSAVSEITERSSPSSS